ncbi:Hypothetical predicted protein [Octopus vulgaris]|uniref:Uncharacterized protein n=1 Tax=Octopus vulgaris TaxID=6645 RepID=A0AA36BLR8_OCTVU|nr:Hypothetical predicted protein [Octopus vulgaris]
MVPIISFDVLGVNSVTPVDTICGSERSSLYHSFGKLNLSGEAARSQQFQVAKEANYKKKSSKSTAAILNAIW